MLENEIIKYAETRKMKLVLRETFGFCRSTKFELPSGNYIYFFVGDADDTYPIYIGSTKRGVKRIREHTTSAGCNTLRSFLECNTPKSNGFLVYMFSCPWKYIFRSEEYSAQRYFNPWIITPVCAGSFVRRLFHNDSELVLPDYVSLYIDMEEKRMRKIRDEFYHDGDKQAEIRIKLKEIFARYCTK